MFWWSHSVPPFFIQKIRPKKIFSAKDLTQKIIKLLFSSQDDILSMSQGALGTEFDTHAAIATFICVYYWRVKIFLGQSFFWTYFQGRTGMILRTLVFINKDWH